MTETHDIYVDHHVPTSHGTVFVRDLPGDETPIVLMHGFPDDHMIYRRLTPQLVPHRVVAFDFLGYGRSARTGTAGSSLAEHGAQIGAVLDELDIDRAVLVGHDASGPDAVAYSLTHPDRVAHLVLVNTIFGRQASLRMPEMTRLFADPQLATLTDDMLADPAQLLWLLQRWGTQWELDSEPDGIAMGSIVPQFFGNDQHPDAVAAIRQWTAQLYDSLDEQDDMIGRGALRDIATPVSIVFGDQDRYLNSCLASEIFALFNQATLQLIPDAGHYPQYDQPTVVAALIKQAITTGRKEHTS
jgi:haloalkane dehalogenase